MAKPDFACYSPKQMYEFINNCKDLLLRRSMTWQQIRVLSSFEPVIIRHFASCSTCADLFSTTLYSLCSFGLLTPEFKDQGNQIVRELRQEIEKEKRDKLGVKVELYKDTQLIDLSTLISFKNITILGYPTNDNYYKYFEFSKILIDDIEIEIVSSLSLNADDHKDLTSDRLEEIIRQYKELT